MSWVINGVNYDEFIASPVWAAIRKERLEIDNYECRGCGRGTASVRLDIHHKRYDNFGGYEDVENDLTTLCSDCHEAITSVMRRLRYSRRSITVDPLGAGAVSTKGFNSVKRKNLQVDIVNTTNHAQWTAGQSAKQMVTLDEGDYIQEKQNGRRS